ncbi:MAG: AAA family ATPase [Chloroflexi bacterium]|nr:AAA family ATPase [Chloroflexota bacterium]MBI3731846.1 AAA family ATPase [Chloroflexota bacterium]
MAGESREGATLRPDLFDQAMQARMERDAPLAARMRPRTLDEIVGQQHMIGPGKLLRRAVETDRLLSSTIFWGPPGTGKTTLAMAIARSSRSHFEILSAVLAGVADIRRVVGESKERLKLHAQRTILVVDEIHRFSKVQQDALLPHVENGTVILIGATTENPYFEVVGPLLSRSRIFQLRPLDDDELVGLLRRALADRERGYGNRSIDIASDALEHLAHVAGGDARTALNALELAVESTAPDHTGVVRITFEAAQESIQRRAIRYDKQGDEHYDTISAFIKSIRGSDPDAALYWLAKMLYAGEDPEFIARRLVIHASEDIGLADPMALVVAVSAAQALQFVGLPEAQLNLAEATLYLATAPKSNSVLGIAQALKAVESGGKTQVPQHLQDPSRDAKGLGHGKGYRYPHDFPDHHIAQSYLPDDMAGQRFYEPSDQGFEKAIAERVKQWRAAIAPSRQG